MKFPNIGFYNRIGDIASNIVMPLDQFLVSIREGDYQDIILPVRAAKDKAERTRLKETLPSVTLSGTFSLRYDKNLLLHSGFIGVDVDDLNENVEAFKDLIEADPYTVAAFASVSGLGVCVVMQIEPDHHREAYQGIAAYYLEKYKISIDPTGINVSRPRFISFDPHIVWNTSWSVFKKYLPKPPARKLPPVVFVQSEFDDVIRKVVEKGVQCCESYRDWISICFGLCNRFGEAGRTYFHQLSAISGKYDYEVADKQYTVALAHEDEWTGDKATLATFYWHAKNAGIDITSDVTKMVASTASALKKKAGYTDPNVIAAHLQQFDGLAPEDTLHIITQALDSGYKFHEENENVVGSLIAWLRSNYDFKFNQVTHRLELDGKVVDDMTENSVYLKALETFQKLTFELFRRVLISDVMPQYNPLREWFFANQELPYNDEILRFWRCIPTASQREFDRMVYFGTKWLISVVASIFGDPSPLVLVLAGEKHGTGKTEVFRRLLPKEWRGRVDYYAESKLDSNEADVAQLMCSKVIIMDDEFGGQSKKELRKFKAMTSRATFSVRKSYGRNSEDLTRLAVMCGTCQELELLNDPTGDQRRLIPVHVVDTILFEKMNAVDRSAMWAELYRQYKAGENYKILGEDIQHLKIDAEKFTEYSLEYEAIDTHYEKPMNDNNIGIMDLTATEIKTHIEQRTNQRLDIKKLGQELKRMGFKQIVKKRGGVTARVYQVIEKRIGTTFGNGGYVPLQ